MGEKKYCAQAIVHQRKSGRVKTYSWFGAMKSRQLTLAAVEIVKG